MAVQKCPTEVYKAAVTITNGHNVHVAVWFEMATNTVYISYRILCDFPVITISQAQRKVVNSGGAK